MDPIRTRAERTNAQYATRWASTAAFDLKTLRIGEIMEKTELALVKDIRWKLCMTQAELAFLMGVHPITVSKWERFVAKPSHYQMAMLTAFYEGAKKDTFLGRKAKEMMALEGVPRAIYILLKGAFEDINDV